MSLTEHTEFTERKQKEQSVGFIRRRRIKPTSFSVASVNSSEPSERVRNASAGFSLVEISLALLIVAIGMLAILGMFPSGLDQNARSISDTHAALFAEEVFSALRVHAETNWDRIGNPIGATFAERIPVAASNNWHLDYDLKIWLDNAMATNVYRHPGDSNIVDHAFRYRITLVTNGLIKSAFLRFWPGEFGTTNNPTMFYSEFYRINR